MNRNNLILIGLILISLLLRLYKFGSIPTALNRDEAALGYNAYTIGKFGIDEWNEKYPLMFRSFGDYKLPGYIYVLSVWVNIFGVSDVIIRLPSLLAGVWIIWISYKLVFAVTEKKSWATMAAAAIAFQPWAIFYSRMAYEANLGLALFLTALYFGWKFLQRKNILILICFGLFYLAAIFTYNSPLLLAPVLVVFLLTSQAARFKWRVILATMIIVIAGVASFLLWPVTSQKQSITIFSDPTVTYNQMQGYAANTNMIGKLWWNRYVYRLRIMTINLVNSFGPKFLLTSGGTNPWHSIPGKSHLMITTYLLFFISVFYVFKKKPKLKSWLPWSILLIGSLLPAIVTVDAPHATRSLFFFWLLTVISVKVVSGRRFILIVLFLLALEVAWWGNLYFGKFSKLMGNFAWPYGLEQALTTAKTDYQAGKSVYIFDSAGLSLADDQIYIYPLLYYQVNPILYQGSANISPPDIVGMTRVNSFDKVLLDKKPDQAGVIIIERDKNGKFTIK